MASLVYDHVQLNDPILLVPFNRPTRNIQINRTDIIHLVDPNIGDADLVAKKSVDILSGITKVNSGGLLYRGTAIANGSIIMPSIGSYTLSEFTMVLIFTPNSNTGARTGLCGNFDNIQDWILCRRNPPSTVQFYIKNSSGIQYGSASPPSSLTVGTKTICLFRYNGENITVFKDGAKGSDITASGVLNIDESIDDKKIKIGRGIDTSTQDDLDCDVEFFCMFNVALTNQECFELMKDPYSVVSPIG